MTHKEKIIATAYTGVMFVDGSEIGNVYAYEEEKLGHGVIDIMHANKDFQQKVRNAVKQDFLAMINKQEEINEEELDTLAWSEYPDDDDDDTLFEGIDRYDYREAFKAGCRKILEYLSNNKK